MVARGFLRLRGEDVSLTPAGAHFVRCYGIDLARLEAKRAPLCRQCLDWSERRSHLAGGLGRALLERFEELGWAKRKPDTRIVEFSRRGRAGFDELIARG
jgi:hypothetical protein